MPAPRWVARANKKVLNRVTRFIAPWAPGWAVVIHRGRKSQRVYRTPLWAFRRQDGFVIALTYGSQADWVRNALAADGCELEARRRRYQVGSPRVYYDEDAADMPAFIRFMLRKVIKAPEFLRVDVVRELSAVQPRAECGSRPTLNACHLEATGRRSRRGPIPSPPPSRRCDDARLSR